jgi:hypothetical protein
MPQESRCYIIVNCCHAVKISNVDGMLKDFIFFLEIIESLLIKKLPQKLNWWLRSILLFDRHIKIIDKNDNLRNTFWTNDMLTTSLIKFSLNLLLYLSTGCSRAEDDL